MLTARRFILLRGTPTGPVFYRGVPGMFRDPSDWTEQRDDAHRFDTWDDAEAVRDAILVREGIAVGIVPAEG